MTTTKKKTKSPLREWIDALFFAIIAATLIRWLVAEAFTIPTPSMEKTLLIGDFLFVSKLHYGTRTPITPLQIPLTHQKIWGTNLPSYTDLVQLPYFRLWGFSSIQRNDVVVFNYPDDDFFPTDLKTHYIKRCVAVAGDKFEIRDTKVYINGNPQDNPLQMQTNYYGETTEGKILEKEFYEFNITDFRPYAEGYEFNATPAEAATIEKSGLFKQIVSLKDARGMNSERVFPHSRFYDWSGDNFGTFEIPKAGQTVRLDSTNIDLYEKIITRFEGNKNVEIRKGRLYIDNIFTDSYTFKQNYYFMMGDNRHNSEDSRYWGLVPEDHIIGKGWFVWLSIAQDYDGKTPFYDRIRWNRIGSAIE